MISAVGASGRTPIPSERLLAPTMPGAQKIIVGAIHELPLQARRSWNYRETLQHTLEPGRVALVELFIEPQPGKRGLADTQSDSRPKLFMLNPQDQPAQRPVGCVIS